LDKLIILEGDGNLMNIHTLEVNAAETSCDHGTLTAFVLGSAGKLRQA
jgi:hypothetical protein